MISLLGLFVAFLFGMFLFNRQGGYMFPKEEYDEVQELYKQIRYDFLKEALDQKIKGVEKDGLDLSPFIEFAVTDLLGSEKSIDVTFLLQNPSQYDLCSQDTRKETQTLLERVYGEEIPPLFHFPTRKESFEC